MSVLSASSTSANRHTEMSGGSTRTGMTVCVHQHDSICPPCLLTANIAVTVVSPNSYFSFTPFLASTTVGTLEYRCATEPVRGIKGVHFSQGWAERIDFNSKRLTVESAVPAPKGSNIPQSDASSGSQNAPDRSGVQIVKVEGDKEFYDIEYDKLVIAVGCYSASLGIEGVSEAILPSRSRS